MPWDSSAIGVAGMQAAIPSEALQCRMRLANDHDRTLIRQLSSEGEDAICQDIRHDTSDARHRR